MVKVPQKQQGGGTSGLWRYDWVNRQYITEEKDFPQTKCFDKGCEFIEKNHAQDDWLLHLETFDPHEPFYVPQKADALEYFHKIITHFFLLKDILENIAAVLCHRQIGRASCRERV